MLDKLDQELYEGAPVIYTVGGRGRTDLGLGMITTIETREGWQGQEIEEARVRGENGMLPNGRRSEELVLVSVIVDN